MKRLHYIYCAAPLMVALNTIPSMFGGMGQIVAALVIGVALWGAAWVRLYTNKKLRPEFAIMVVLPALGYFVLRGLGSEYLAVFSTPGWQNFNFFLWLASIWVSIQALFPTPAEYKGRLIKDSVLVFMSIITIIYSLSCWMNIHSTLLNLNQQ